MFLLLLPRLSSLLIHLFLMTPSLLLHLFFMVYCQHLIQFSNLSYDHSNTLFRINRWSFSQCSMDPTLAATLLCCILHTELRNVHNVQEHTCTQSTGVYTEYGECTQSMGLYKLVRRVQALYELWQWVTSTRGWSVWHWVTTTIHIHMQSCYCLYSSRRTILGVLENFHSMTVIVNMRMEWK